jgi:diguanylate cyclase (GGDEF)-like protein
MQSIPTIPPPSDTGPAAPDDKPSILLVEDEATSRLIVSRQLERAGYDVQAVSNGAEALAILRKRFIPLLITDWEMPELNGVALCGEIRKMPLEGYIYMILLTAREGKANVIEGLQAGADDYLTKPPDDNELLARLNTGRRILKLEQSLRAANLRIRLLSVTDALTATFNRRYLMERLPQEIERARQRGGPLSVVLCDADHFKDVNDLHGHQAGDRVLQSYAKLLMDSTRQDIDWVARYGGEEFLIVLPGTTVNDAIAFAEKLRVTVAGHSFDIAGGALKVTSSFGVAGYDSVQARQDTGVDALIANADRCLYQSKEQGRNRITGKCLG